MIKFKKNYRVFLDQPFPKVLAGRLLEYHIRGIFYCSDWKAENPGNLAARVFIQNFPNVYAAVKGLKGKNRSSLPVRLMRGESEVIIHGVCRWIAERGDENFFVATIHDCILTKEDNAETVMDLLAGLFREKYSRVPTLKVQVIN